MATEVATLTFKANTADLERAEKALDDVTKSGREAQKSTEELTTARDRNKKSTDSSTQADKRNTSAKKRIVKPPKRQPIRFASCAALLVS
jgi:hypothetical protein